MFLMDLCVEFREVRPDAMLERIGDAPLFALWQAYWQLNPFGYWRHNLHAILSMAPHCKELPPVEELIVAIKSEENLDELMEQFNAHKAERDADQG